MSTMKLDLRFGHDPKLYSTLSVIKRQLMKGVVNNYVNLKSQGRGKQILSNNNA